MLAVPGHKVSWDDDEGAAATEAGERGRSSLEYVRSRLCAARAEGVDKHGGVGMMYETRMGGQRRRAN